ncbi:MAG: GspMb/PilO family protein [Betaproteobacteria bacterium]
MTPLKRILTEKRAVLLPLALVLLVNAGVYALVVYPLEARAAGASSRAEVAARALGAAEREQATARALVSGKARADQEIATFYEKVLPADISAARRLTYARLPALARQSDVTYEASTTEPEVENESKLGRLKTRMVLQGGYESLRRFIYALESAPEFVIIDDVTLRQADEGKPLMLTLELSTYYRLGANGGA